MIRLVGGPLTENDLASLRVRGIAREMAERQYLRRVTSDQGAEIVGRNGRGDWSGWAIPYIEPGTDRVREFRLRRDNPEIENGKPTRKYYSPPGRGNMTYHPVGTDPAALSDPRLRMIITEGELKAISLYQASLYGRHPGDPRFLVVGLAGVWNWRGIIGKTTDANGHRVDVKGPIPDLDRIVWDGRHVLIIFDADIEENESVRAARVMLTRELRLRGAHVSWFEWPADRPAHAKGIDDLLGAIGPEKVLALIEAGFARVEDVLSLLPFHFADSGNAERLVALHGADLRYCFPFRKWLVWDGRRWAIDDRGQAVRLVKLTMLRFLHQAIEAKNESAEKFARLSLESGRLNAALSLAQCELPIAPQELDRDRQLLNFTNGTVDLKAGKLRPHRRADYITKMVAFPYRPEARCPRWLQFQGEIMGSHPDATEDELARTDELVDFIQAALGYSVTGETGEKVVFVPHGSGDNGKTTMLSVVRDVIAEYSVTVGLDLLTTRDDSNNVAAARAKLLGARFVTSSETEEGQRLSAARLKRICQGPGGQIEACRKYENPITFPETHKLWIDANHKPELSATDAAVWNRLRLIPFTVTIPKEKQNRNLIPELLAEAEGILAWLVKGAKRWYADGLPDSDIVAAATKQWQEDLDRLPEFLEARTRKADGSEAYLRNKVLYESYKGWCESNGERSLSQRKFSSQMLELGYKQDKTNTGRRWLGILFKPDEADK